MGTLFLIRPTLKDEIRACQRDVSNPFEEEELGWNEMRGRKTVMTVDCHGLPFQTWKAAEHFASFLQVTLTSLQLHRRGKLRTLSSWKSLPRRARMPCMDVGNKTLCVSEAASPIFGLEVRCL